MKCVALPGGGEGPGGSGGSLGRCDSCCRDLQVESERRADGCVYCIVQVAGGACHLLCRLGDLLHRAVGGGGEARRWRIIGDGAVVGSVVVHLLLLDIGIEQLGDCSWVVGADREDGGEDAGAVARTLDGRGRGGRRDVDRPPADGRNGRE